MMRNERAALPSTLSATKIEETYSDLQLKLLAERRMPGVFRQLGVPALLSRRADRTAAVRRSACGNRPAGQ